MSDAHRQRIINWINATGGTSSAFDVTTKVHKASLVLTKDLMAIICRLGLSYKCKVNPSCTLLKLSPAGHSPFCIAQPILAVNRLSRKTIWCARMVALACCYFSGKPWYWINTGLTSLMHHLLSLLFFPFKTLYFRTSISAKVSFYSSGSLAISTG